MKRIGLYIHVPFCLSKCPYCDFYSLTGQEEAMLDRYTEAVLCALDRWAERLTAAADTLYFGGGTPSLLGGQRIARILRRAEERFALFADGTPEITMEANPADNLRETLAAFAAAGGNRLSIGMQSAVPAELTALGRRHRPADVARTAVDAAAAGIQNLSLDIMLGIPGQTVGTAEQSIRVAASLGATHLSAYLLKLEPGTPYAQSPPPLPPEDEEAAIYLAAMERMESLGYRQYEISNLSQPGYESRHNLKYWDGRPYLGIGPAASSYIGGRRFCYARDIVSFLRGEEPIEETDRLIPAGSPEEYGLLRLRLAEGLTVAGFTVRFGRPLPESWLRRAAALPARLVTADARGIRLTREGFLLSNTLIEHILLK